MTIQSSSTIGQKAKFNSVELMMQVSNKLKIIINVMSHSLEVKER